MENNSLFIKSERVRILKHVYNFEKNIAVVCIYSNIMVLN